MNGTPNSDRVKFRQAAKSCRSGKMLVFFALLLPPIFGILGLVIDGGMMRLKYRILQNAADAASTAAAAALAGGQSNSVATNAAVDYVKNGNGLSAANVTVLIPPENGPYSGQAGYVEVQVSLSVSTFFMQVVRTSTTYLVKATSVSGCKKASAGGAIVVLDPNPPGVTVPVAAGISLPATPSLSLGGLEVLGIGQLQVSGAVLVDTDWGGLDQNGDPAGQGHGLRSAVTCMPLVSLTSLAAEDIRVTGGVDNPNNYSSIHPGQPSPLKANRKPVPDPLNALPVPTISVDPVHVSDTLRGGVSIATLPIIGPVTTLRPGVYDYIQVITGPVVMQSGVYIIRGRNPLTGIPLQLLGGTVTANGVMFYITDSANYSAVSGTPDDSNNNVTPPPLSVLNILPSAVIDTGLLGTKLTPLTGTGSVYDGVILFQNRTDRRIIVIGGDLLLSSASFNGNIYAKWGHVIFAGQGTFDAGFVAGSVRIVNVLDISLKPSKLFAPAQDVFLVQ